MESAAILAGGRATRFGGRDKGALVVNGQTILERQIAELSRVTTDILIVGGNGAGARRAGGVTPRVISDIVPGCGPLGGIHAALTEARGDAIFVAACDMPYLDASLIRYLLGWTRAADVVVPRTKRGYHPLCAAYTRACLPAVARRLADRRLKMTALLEEVRVRELTAREIDVFGDRHRLLANVNTPADYEEFEGLRGH